MDCDAQVFPVYRNHRQTAWSSLASFRELAEKAKSPTTGPKESAAAITPFKAMGKTKAEALKAEYFAIVIDHDEDDRDRQSLAALYDQYGFAYLAYTTASHQQPKGDRGPENRWKVVIPLSRSISHQQYTELALGAAYYLNTDKAQASAQQIFYAPNKLFEGAPYESIVCIDKPLLCTDE